MNVVNLHSSCTMMLLGILASTTIIGLTSSAPLSSYERREDVSDDRPKIFLLMDQRIPELENEILGNELGSEVTRAKRIGSLSIVNNLDVLRQRVLLELARRKALQDQRQIDENRRVLESIGKRSVSGSDAGRIAARSGKSRNNNNRGEGSSAMPNRLEWIEEDDPLTRVQANELRLL